MIEAKAISKVFPNGFQGLDQITFQAAKGESIMLMGHNGSGKSTLFRCLSGLERPTEGQVLIAGSQISGLKHRQMRDIRKKIGMVFQHFNLIPNLSVFQNVLFGALGSVPTALHAFSMFAAKDIRMDAMECLDRVGLAGLATRRADQLSGGQKQRVAIARMLMQQPEIILADEPIASLDPKAGKHIMELMSEIAKERKLAVVTILHHLDLALEYGDRVLMLKEGKLVLDADCQNLTRSELERFYETDTLYRASREGA